MRLNFIKGGENMAQYTEYHPLKFWLDPASIAEIVAHIQAYLVANPINSTTEIETIIHDYLIEHPEIIGGVRSINGETGEVVLTADNISGGENVTIADVLDSLQDQIDDIVASIPSDYQQLINDVSDLKSATSKLNELIEIQTSVNKWNPDLSLTDKSISTASATRGEVVSGSNAVSNFVPARKNDSVMWYYSNSTEEPSNMAISTTAVRIAEYDKNFNCLLVTSAWPKLPYTVSNDSAHYVRIEVAKRNWNMIIVNGYNVSTINYVAYKPDLNLIDNIKQVEVGNPGLTLPSKYPAVSGQNYWIYFENALANIFLKDVTVTTEKDAQTRREALKENRSNSGDFSKTVYVYKNGNLITQQHFTISCVPVATAENHHVTVLCIGDSKTEAIGKRVTINELAADDPYLSIDFVGTQGVVPTLSEGYSSRNIVDLCTSPTLNNKTNIFYDSSISGDIKFNFSYGVSQLSASPDIVFIDHGANQYGIAWSTISECYEAIITSIHAYNANIKVVICVQEGSGLALKPDYTQGNKIAYGLGNSADNYSIPKMVNAFDNRESENVFLCPQYLCVDPIRDYPLALLPVSEANTLREYFCLDSTHPGTNINSWDSSKNYTMYAYVKRNEIPYAALRESQGVDPATDNGTYWTPIVNPEAGYRKIGEMYYAVIKHLVSVT